MRTFSKFSVTGVELLSKKCPRGRFLSENFSGSGTG